MWQRGVDTTRFNPSYRSEAMRAELSGGHPKAPLLVHVGRLGAGGLPCSRRTMAVVLLARSTSSTLAMSACCANISSWLCAPPQARFAPWCLHQSNTFKHLETLHLETLHLESSMRCAGAACTLPGHR